ncbi:MAG TPA: DUF3617 domain-containing protein [Aquabacterium sp.]|uniref:DUF3617 domain-containing protein n=1 Tax=Aquabacterium sp. TaxID=1872578 RepID=UPI002E3409AD|nr:DUF3617 domain-containing protein [Aquabacterium sp.]HEX5355264.1 DUF3617 domain-containing protein [Aquabacterium sp.]
MPARAPALTVRHLLGSALLIVLPASAMAVDMPPMKPGLWEVSPESQLLNGKPVPDMSAKMAEQMKRMPPEMRAQVEAQMKAHGVQMAPGGNGMAMRMCITKDMLSQNRWQKMDGRCQNTALKQTGSTWSWKFTCTDPASEGEGSTTFQGGDAYTSDMQVRTTRNGQAQTMSMKHRGKWLGADCGGLKPIEPPSK